MNYRSTGISGMKELPDGTPVMYGQDYEVEFKKYEEKRRQREKFSDLEEVNKRIEADQDFQKKRSEHEMINRYFITLATLSAASITLLIQHVFLSFDLYDMPSQFFIKITLMLFGCTLLASVLHNYVNTKSDLPKLEMLTVKYVGMVALFAYISGISLFLFTVVASF